jgi:hypothetical protein
VGSGLGRSEEEQKRRINWSSSAHMHWNNTWKLPVQLSVSQASEVSCFQFYLLYFFFYRIRQQEGRAGSGEGGLLAPVGGGVGREKGRRMNMCKQCIHMNVNAKHDNC